MRCFLVQRPPKTRPRTNFGLLLPMPFFRRQPRAVQRLDDLAAETLDRFTHGGRLNVLMAKLPPIDILTLTDHRKDGVVAPLRTACLTPYEARAPERHRHCSGGRSESAEPKRPIREVDMRGEQLRPSVRQLVLIAQFFYLFLMIEFMFKRSDLGPNSFNHIYVCRH